MDTWATSSLTPQIAGGWVDDPDLFARVFPMDMRPQAHDIIRTWLFATVVRSHHEHGCLPWSRRGDLRLDPRPRPQEDVEVQGQRRHADGPARAVRHRRRALLGGVGPARRRHRVRRGADEDRPQAGHQAAQRQQVRARLRRAAGRRACRPRRSTGRCSPASPTSSTRRPRAFEGFDYARALERTEAFFWWFCDDYVELVKGRAYGTQGDDAGALGAGRAAPRARRVQRLFAPFLPFVTEEVWSWWHDGSVHAASWPTPTRWPSAGDASLLDAGQRGAGDRSAGPRPRPSSASGRRSTS